MHIKIFRPMVLLLILGLCCVAAEERDGADKSFEALTTQLGSKDEAERKKAYEALAAAGANAEKALVRSALKGKDLECELARELLRHMVIERSALPPIDDQPLVNFKLNPEAPGKGDPNLRYDKDRRIVAVNGEFCLAIGALEFVVAAKGPDAPLHESVVVADVRPLDFSWVLLLCEYTFFDELIPGQAVKLPPKAGLSLSIEFDWKPLGAKEGRRVRLPIEAFIWNAQTETTMKRAPFVFTGSRTVRHNDRNLFLADVECLLVALEFRAEAVLNTPLDTNRFNPDEQACYEINSRIILKSGTKCRIVFEPYEGPAPDAEDLKDSGEKARGRAAQRDGPPRQKASDTPPGQKGPPEKTEKGEVETKTEPVE